MAYYGYDAFGSRRPRPTVPTFVGNRLVKCQKCGTESLRWAESKTKVNPPTGKPKVYLSESFQVFKYGRTFTNYRPHFKTCAQNQAEDALVTRDGLDSERSSWADDVANGRTDDAMHNYAMHLEMGVYGSDSDYSTNEDL